MTWNGKQVRQFTINKTNNAVNLANTAPVDTPDLTYDIGGAYGAVITSLSIGYNAAFQANAYFQVQLDGVILNPAVFIQPSQQFNTFNYLQGGADYYEVPPNASFKIWTYNEGGGSNTELYDLIINYKQLMG